MLGWKHCLFTSSFRCCLTIRNDAADSTYDEALIVFGAGDGTVKGVSPFSPCGVGDDALFETFILVAGAGV
jgi:hypothetical protein